MVFQNTNNMLVFSIVPRTGFVMVGLVFNMCVEVYGLIVLNTSSIRGLQVLLYAVLSCNLVDVSLTLGGHTRFMGDVFVSVVPTPVTNLLGSSPWS